MGPWTSIGWLRGFLGSSGESQSWRLFTLRPRLVDVPSLDKFPFRVHPQPFAELSLREMKSSSGLQTGLIQLGSWGSTNTRTFSKRAGRMTRAPFRASLYTTTRATGILLIVRIPAPFFFFNNPCAYESVNTPVDNWREHVPSEADAPPYHFRNPYPTPTWVVRPSYLSDLTLALPDTLPRSPNRSPEPPPEARGHTRRDEAKPKPGGSFRMCRVYCSQYTPIRGCMDAR